MVLPPTRQLSALKLPWQKPTRIQPAIMAARRSLNSAAMRSTLWVQLLRTAARARDLHASCNVPPTCCRGAWGSSPSEYSRNRVCSVMKGEACVLLVENCVLLAVQVNYSHYHVAGGIHETQLFQGGRCRSPPLSFARTPARYHVTCDC